MATLRFAADNSEVRFNLPAAVDLTGAFTFAKLTRRRATGLWQCIVSHHDSSGTGRLSLEWVQTGFDTPNGLVVSTPSVFSYSQTAVTSTTDWYIVAVTKAAGNATPRFHFKDITTGAAWIHENGKTAMNGNGASASGGTIRVGEFEDVDDLNANDGVLGGWAAALTDLQVEALATNLRTSDWAGHAVAPKYVHELTSKTSIPDLMGNGATLNVVNGTTVETGSDPPGWTFDGVGGGGATQQEATGSAAITTTASGTATVRAQASGMAAIATTATGVATVTAQATASAALIVTAAATATATQQATGSAAVSIGANGAATVTQGASGSAEVSVGAAGAATVMAQAASTAAITFTASGEATVPGGPGQQDATGTAAIVTGAIGTAKVTEQASGSATFVAGASAVATTTWQVAGQAAITFTATATPSLQQSAVGLIEGSTFAVSRVDGRGGATVIEGGMPATIIGG